MNEATQAEWDAFSDEYFGREGEEYRSNSLKMKHRFERGTT